MSSRLLKLSLNASMTALLLAQPTLALAAETAPAPATAEKVQPLPGTPSPTTPPATAPGNPPTLPANVAAGRPDSFADLAAALLPSVVNISTTQTLGKKGAASTEEELGQDDQQDENNGGDGSGENGGNDLPAMPQFPPGSPFEQFFKDFFDKHGQNMPNGGLGGQDFAPRKATSLGSGFIIDGGAGNAKTGPLVVTNNHVIENADEIKVILSDNTKLDAELMGRDLKTDLAVLRVKTDRKLTPVRFGDSDTSRVGDWVLAIGNPFGLGGTVTAGIVSARARDINAGPYDDFIQTDASINRGNSGGPMFNTKGEVIGINTAIYSPSGGSVGIGFAIPANMAKPIIDQLRNSGSIKRGWIGVRIQNVTDDIAQSLGLAKTTGAMVSSIDADGPAAKAGILPGDVILTFNGHPVDEMRRLPRMVAETALGGTVPITVWRQGKEVPLKIKIGELAQADATATKGETPKAKADAQPALDKVEQLGLQVAAITPALRQRFQLDEKARGVLVVEVEPGSDAAEKGVRPGDMLLSIGQHDVATPAEVTANLKSIGKNKPVLLMVERGGDARFVAVMTKK